MQGWRFQLSLFANAVADEYFADAAGLVDAWFTAWSAPETLAGLVAAEVSFRDRYSMLQGVTEVVAHAAAAQRFMPGIRIERTGDARQCQGVVLADWAACAPDGKQVMSGTNVFVYGWDRKLRSVTGVPK